LQIEKLTVLNEQPHGHVQRERQKNRLVPFQQGGSGRETRPQQVFSCRLRWADLGIHVTKRLCYHLDQYFGSVSVWLGNEITAMRINVKPMSVFQAKAPASEAWEVPEGTTIAEVIAQLGIAPDHVHVCTLNDSLQRDLERTLSEGDRLIILPPVVGG